MNKFNSAKRMEFRELVDSKFGGDAEKAVEYLFENEPMEVIVYYLNNSPARDRKAIFTAYKNMLNKGYPGGYDVAADEAKVSHFFEISIADIKSANPDILKSKLRKNFLVYLLSSAAFIAGAGMAKRGGITNTYNALSAPATTAVSGGLSAAMINYSKYKKLLKIYETEEYKKQLPSYLANKELYDKLQSFMVPEKIQEAMDRGLRGASL